MTFPKLKIFLKQPGTIRRQVKKPPTIFREQNPSSLKKINKFAKTFISKLTFQKNR